MIEKNICQDWIYEGGTAFLFRNNKQFVEDFKGL
jgi:hypothetical protein